MNITKNLTLIGRDILNAKIKNLFNSYKNVYGDYDYENLESQIERVKTIKDLKTKKEINNLLEIKQTYAVLDNYIKKQLSNKKVKVTAVWVRRVKNGVYTCNIIFTNLKTNKKERISNFKSTL